MGISRGKMVKIILLPMTALLQNNLSKFTTLPLG